MTSVNKTLIIKQHKVPKSHVCNVGDVPHMHMNDAIEKKVQVLADFKLEKLVNAEKRTY